MTYKETLFFVGKCLTITHETKNKEIIEKELKSGNVDWDNVVKLSTSHYVFPALYCNLKRANFLHYLPNDLVEYMKHITDLNRERNQQIIAQAKEINDLLLANNITPIFLKGTGNLLEGLYEDIAERMAGDIDILIVNNDILKTVKILQSKKYYVFDNKIPKSYGRHYPRLIHDTKICGVEIHRELLRKKHRNHLNYNLISSQIIQNKEKYTSLALPHKFTYNILANQVNDFGYLYRNINLRTIYDTFLFSQKLDTLKSNLSFKYHFNILNDNIALSSLLLNTNSNLKYNNTISSKKFTANVFKNNKFRNKIISSILPFYRGLIISKQIITTKEYFTFFILKFFNKNWYKERFFNTK
ncbi:nucleotidyltransferase family protein [uncultured Tenacibaculum sp.]|uniref:nucleotidyltransferase domain-containing protein n=1 Tax=uncultured Tenacibaculum sp. TaxID=174713 RepID=UPI00260BF0DC|nr:nucleotidyltransferase family protein [uncultured Tenacibaculum sp.]